MSGLLYSAEFWVFVAFVILVGALFKKVSTALGLGIAVVLVQAITIPANNLILNLFLKPGAMSWLGCNWPGCRKR